MAQNEILQIVVFAVFFAVALGAMPERAKPIMGLIDDLGHIMLKVTGYVMLFAPLAVWAAIMATVSKNGLGVLWKLIQFMGGFYLSLMILWAILVVVGFIVIGPRYKHLLRLIREPLDDRVLDREFGSRLPEDAGGPQPLRRVVADIGFVLPLGYSFNLDGTMMYCTFASIFIAQTYNIQMSLGTQLAMLATLMITSKGVAGVPRASLVVIASTLEPVRHSRGGAADDHGHRHLPRHGAQRHQCDRQLARHRSGGEMGRRTRARWMRPDLTTGCLRT